MDNKQNSFKLFISTSNKTRNGKLEYPKESKNLYKTIQINILSFKTSPGKAGSLVLKKTFYRAQTNIK